MPVLKKDFVDEDKEMSQIDSNAVKMAIKDIIENKEDDSASDDSEEDKAGKPKKKRQGHKDKKKDFGGLPRKCFKKLIKKELDKQCHNIFNDMINCKELGG